MGDHIRYSREDRGRPVSKNTIAFIDAAPLTRECFTRVVESEYPGIKVAAFESVEDWKLAERETHFDAVTCSVGPGNLISIGVVLRDLVAQASPTPVVALADVDSIEMMTAAVNCGALGCIPTRIGVDALIHAVRLISSGCVALPVTAFMKTRPDIPVALAEALLPRISPEEARGAVPERSPEQVFPDNHGLADSHGDVHGDLALLTPRQRMVAEALRQGKANKVIARELNICENTVKVHIRVIMRKLKVSNRTEAAFKMSLIISNYSETARPS